MKQKAFERLRRHRWNLLEKTLKGGKQGVKRQGAVFPALYREITQDLNIAKAEGFDPDLVSRLNRLVLDCHQYLYALRRLRLKDYAAFWDTGFPRAVRKVAGLILIAHLLFYGTALFVGLFVSLNPNAVYLFVAESTVRGLEGMYDPQAPHFLEPRNIGGDAEMFSFYIYNNISIAFRTFAGGLLAGIGSLLFLCYNGVFMGAVAAHMINLGFSRPFFAFIIAHSSFELTAIVFSAVAGLRLGWSILWTNGLSRADSLKGSTRQVLPLMGGSALMLVFAAVIEAFWSSRHELSFSLKIGAGVALWVFVVGYFLFSGKRESGHGS